MRIQSPAELGLPPQFDRWRPTQEDMLGVIITAQKRSQVFCAPTGSGKSPAAIGIVKITNKPTCIVTYSRGLQDQYLDDFSSIGLVDIRGRRNYPCDMRDEYTCEEGKAARCPYSGSMSCPASKAEAAAAASPLVVTNYEKWIASRKYGTGMSHFQQVIFDEAHYSTEALSNAMQVVLNYREIEEELKTPFLVGAHAESLDEWKRWAYTARVTAECEMLIAKQRITGISDPKPSWVRKFTHMRNLTRKLAILATCKPDNWVVEEIRDGFQFDPINPGMYAESSLLFRIPKVIFISATVKPKTMYMLGQSKTSFDFHEYDSDFDPKRAPIYYIPTMRVDARSKNEMSPLWLKLDQVAARRQDRRGIVQTVSYGRRAEIVASSRFAERMIFNEKGEPPTGVIEDFANVAETDGPILVSPSIGTGYDFADCVAPNTKILTSDLRHVDACTLVPGDKLAAFDEYLQPGRNTRCWKESIVTGNSIEARICRKLTFIDGTEVICSEDHPWLTFNDGGSRWMKTKKIKVLGPGILRAVPIWETASDWESGYLAGIWDGEGCLSVVVNKWRAHRLDPTMTIALGMAQTDNVTLSTTLRILESLGYRLRTYVHEHLNKPTWKAITRVDIAARKDMLRFIGSIRPPRILEKFDINKVGSMKPCEALPVIRNEPIGKQEVSLLSTSTQTYIANGMAAHNSLCRWNFLCKIPFDPPSKILKAREEKDKEYRSYRAVQKMQQGFGRHIRSKSDWGEGFICDTHLDWFWPRYQHLATKAFKSLFIRTHTVPPPLRKEEMER